MRDNGFIIGVDGGGTNCRARLVALPGGAVRERTGGPANVSDFDGAMGRIVATLGGLVAEAGLYADRVSINIELPREESLKALAPEKTSTVIKSAMGKVKLGIAEAKVPARKARPPKFAPAGQSTQMIIGADTASDGEILERSSRLYGAYGLRRVYYSAFSPIQEASAKLPAKAPPLVREHRLYQADWLMRYYGFAHGEIAPATGMLDLEIDPKLAWALAHREAFPIDLNRADREMLLRTPGLYPMSRFQLLCMKMGLACWTYQLFDSAKSNKKPRATTLEQNNARALISAMANLYFDLPDFLLKY